MDFDPYYVWLGIGPEERPVDAYRLLGLRRFEPSPDVISNASDKQLAHVRTFQAGPRSAESQRLLNEISQATNILLDPPLKATYDHRLMAASYRPPLGLLPVAELVKPMQSLPEPPCEFAPELPPLRRSKPEAQWIPAIAGLIVLIIVLGAAWRAYSTKPGVAPKQNQKTQNSKPPRGHVR